MAGSHSTKIPFVTFTITEASEREIYSLSNQQYYCIV